MGNRVASDSQIHRQLPDGGQLFARLESTCGYQMFDLITYLQVDRNSALAVNLNRHNCSPEELC
jgi:hypothetical protein